MHWFERTRVWWIGDALFVYGFINREHLQRKFGISQPQASKDLATFARLYPGRMAYDLTRKCYVRTDNGGPTHGEEGEGTTETETEGAGRAAAGGAAGVGGGVGGIRRARPAAADRRPRG
jgi:hypothetical protein